MRKKPSFLRMLIICGIAYLLEVIEKQMLNITMHTSEIREFRFSVGLHIYRNHSCYFPSFCYVKLRTRVYFKRYIYLNTK